MMPTSVVEPELLSKQRRFQMLATVLITLVCVLLGLAMYILYLQNEKLTDLARANRSNSALLVECTTPPELRHPPVVVKPGKTGADCYLRSRQETGKVVKSIRDISVAAAACGAAHPGDIDETEACVNRTLSQK